MAKTILMDEFHLTFTVPTGLTETEYDTIRQALDGARFRSALGRALRDVVRRYPPLRRVRIRVTC